MDLLDNVASLWRLAGPSAELRLIGGIAVRLHVGASSRVTRHIDVAALTEASRTALIVALEGDGWEVGATGRWWRAAKSGEPLIDIASHPIVSPRTFDAITLRGPAVTYDIAGTRVPVASPCDLVLLKLVAARDQDAVDLALLAQATSVRARDVAEAAAADDIARIVAEGAARVRHTLAHGTLAELIEEITGRAPAPSTLAPLGRLLDDLRKECL